MIPVGEQFLLGVSLSCLEFCYVPMGDPSVDQMLDDLEYEYRSRYGRLAEGLKTYPTARFAPPHGALLSAPAR